MTIKKSTHCRICENYVKDKTTGVKCGLTGKQPTFDHKCEKITPQLDRLYKRIEDANIQHKKVERTKGLTISNFIFFLIISVSIMLAGYLFGRYAFNHGIITNAHFGIMGLGLLLLPLAFGPVRKYIQEIAVANDRKKELEEMLRIYGMDYEIEVDMRKGNHDFFEVTTKLQINKNGKNYAGREFQQTVNDKKKLSEMFFG